MGIWWSRSVKIGIEIFIADCQLNLVKVWKFQCYRCHRLGAHKEVRERERKKPPVKIGLSVRVPEVLPSFFSLYR